MNALRSGNASPKGSRRVHEFIAFVVRQQEFCVDITAVREIRGWSQATRLPHVPDYVAGVINLRGTILPIIDVARRFGMSASTPNEHNVTIVTQIGDRVAGMLVDSVSDIVHVEEENVRPLPEVNSDMAREFLRQVVIHDKRILCEIELNRLMPELLTEAAA